jgi:hypothetical protein
MPRTFAAGPLAYLPSDAHASSASRRTYATEERAEGATVDQDGPAAPRASQAHQHACESEQAHAFEDDQEHELERERGSWRERTGSEREIQCAAVFGSRRRRLRRRTPGFYTHAGADCRRLSARGRAGATPAARAPKHARGATGREDGATRRRRRRRAAHPAGLRVRDQTGHGHDRRRRVPPRRAPTERTWTRSAGGSAVRIAGRSVQGKSTRCDPVRERTRRCRRGAPDQIGRRNRPGPKTGGGAGRRHAACGVARRFGGSGAARGGNRGRADPALARSVLPQVRRDRR